MIKKHLWWILPLLLLAVFTPFSNTLDQSTATYYYAHRDQPHPLYDFIYSYAAYPVILIGVIALFILCGSYFISSWKKWRKPCLFLVLTMLVGAQFIVHNILKDHWGRPRPKQTIEYGGTQPFRPYYSPNFFHQPEPSKSFPCGHCTMGFYFFGFTFLCLRYGYRGGAWVSFLFAILFGMAFGIARMAQGGHYLSDIVATALIMWLTAGLCDWLIYETGDAS
jgi:lipid A 4'-phosphatase